MSDTDSVVERAAPPVRTARGPREQGERAAAREALGRAIRHRRRELGMTLSGVAEIAGVSVSLLSQVERGLSDPSLDSLRDIALALDTTPFRLLEVGHVQSHVVRAGNGLRLSLPDAEVEYELLSPSSEGAFQVAKSTLLPGGASMRAPRPHPGEEAAYVLAGHVRIELGQEIFDLDPGDCVTYDPRIPHRTVASPDGPATILYVSSPPSV